jgi:response regulator RpfG family c-di-GMP phosphodiesterase
MISEAKVLFVDDDPKTLQMYQRRFQTQFQLETAASGNQGLEALEKTGPYAAVVTDMQMPSMNGIEFLRRVKQQFPDTVRLMLTGNHDLKTAIAAVNDGYVFRFLTKPCSADMMTSALTAALEQYALLTAERELLSGTLRGSVDLLADMLSILSPTAFGRTSRIRHICSDVCARLTVTNSWELTVAATLALLGCITVPEPILTRLDQGELLTEEEQSRYNEHPKVGGRLISRIPRLKGVAEIVERQNEPYRLTATLGATDRNGLAANILKTAMDFETFIAQGDSHADAIARLKVDPGLYRPEVVEALAACLPRSTTIRKLKIMELSDGMILDENLMSLNGNLLLARGTAINEVLRERLIMLVNTSRGVKEPILVQCFSE